MVVQHNLQAMNANRMLGVTQKSVATNTEKLSSGYRINRAADDAAGLAISEKMRKQIRGLDQASSNAEDGISCVQTAEGALAEVQDMLQRMNELVVQAANGTNSTTDRQYIQDEIDQLISEVDRVAETTKFNEIYLLQGEETGNTTLEYTFNYLTDDTIDTTGKSNVKNGAGQQVKVNYNGTDNVYVVSKSISTASASSPLTADVVSKGSDFTKYIQTGTVGESSSVTAFIMNTTSYVAFKSTDITDGDLSVVTSNGNLIDDENDAYILDVENKSIIHIKKGEDLSPYIGKDANGNYEMNNGYRLLEVVSNGSTGFDKVHGTDLATKLSNKDFIGASSSYKLYDKDGQVVSGVALDKYFNENGEYLGGLFTNENATVSSSVPKDLVFNYVSKNTEEVSEKLSFSLHVGADSTRTNKITANIESMSAAGLGIAKLRSSAVGIVDETGDNATDAIDIIAAAIQKVSTQRSALGAVQNRLDHTIKNLDNVVENTTAAESAIRDTDMAEEMVAYSNNNVLQQAGQSMLAQANQANQGILSLLQ